MRALTDVEAHWYRLKHPEMTRAQQDAEIAKGLPDDTEPITRADLHYAPADPHAFSRSEWDRRRKARKTAAASRRKNRR